MSALRWTDNLSQVEPELCPVTTPVPRPTFSWLIDGWHLRQERMCHRDHCHLTGRTCKLAFVGFPLGAPVSSHKYKTTQVTGESPAYFVIFMDDFQERERKRGKRPCVKKPLFYYYDQISRIQLISSKLYITWASLACNSLVFQS